MSKERVAWLDIAKGIAIILVVLGHSNLPKGLNSFIFSFHVPLFFFVAGMTNDFSKPIGIFFKRRVRTLLLPFVVYSAIILFMRSFVSEQSLGELAWRFVKEGWISVPLWFVPVLFVALIIVRLTFIVDNKVLRTALWIFIPLISIDLSSFNTHLPWNMSVAPFAVGLILIGHLSKEVVNTHVKNGVLGLLCLPVVVVISQICRLDMCFNHVLPVTLILVGAIAGSFAVFTLSYWIENHLFYISKVLQGIGKETYLILAFAEIIIVYFNYFFNFNFVVKYCFMILIIYLLSWVRKFSKL